jgi:deazaflavin-dependent oxidoreductase (nitroreductase family)
MSSDLKTPPRTRLGARLLNLGGRAPKASIWPRLQAWVYRASGGRLGGTFFGGGRIMVLETVGRKSGQLRRTPVMRVECDGALVVIPANGGNDRTPAWWLNLRAAGEGWVIYRGRRTRVVPRVAEGDERARLWELFCAAYPLGADYPKFTARRLPVVVLEPVA